MPLTPYTIPHCWRDAPVWTGEIDCADDGAKLGAAVKAALASGAVLSDADLTGADLTGAVLSDADLSGADLRRAVLSDAVLTGADLTGAVLSDADLTGAVLRRADLTGADLRRAVLRRAVLRRAVLSDADLTGAVLSDADLSGAPKIERIHASIYAAASQPGALDMSTWHCGTAHCRAGWAVALAGEAGKALEAEIGTAAAATLIYIASDPTLDRVPSWYASNNEALADMRRLAEREAAL